ncbi:hypothetical protein R6G00_00355, partial [Streptomyces roseofulvus]|nr:hypothetical protein [Streptomyces roseolus]
MLTPRALCLLSTTLLAGYGVTARAAPAIAGVVCPGPADGAYCGTVSVPLDRANAARGSITVGFRLYAPAVAPTGTIVARQGGPGPAS